MRNSGQAIDFGGGAVVHSLSAIRHAHGQLHRLTGMRTSPTVPTSQIDLCDQLLIEISDIQEPCQGSGTDAPVIGERPICGRREVTSQERRERRERVLSSAASASAMRNSSSLWPDWSAATNHLGRLPRPDHVSVGTSGLRYFGRTFGYLRRRRLPLAVSFISLVRCFGFSWARRFSSSSFSAVILSERILVSRSCKSQSSSKSIDSSSNLLIALDAMIDRWQSVRGHVSRAKILHAWMPKKSPAQLHLYY
jgi:hypothetical protein